MHSTDQQVLCIIKTSKLQRAFGEMQVFDTPVYLTHTSLVEDIRAIARVPFRFIVLPLPIGAHLTILADPTLDVQ